MISLYRAGGAETKGAGAAVGRTGIDDQGLDVLTTAGGSRGDKNRTSNGNRQKEIIHSAHCSFLSSGLQMVEHTRHPGKTPRKTAFCVDTLQGKVVGRNSH
jgi:hypothetical protein